MSYALLGCVRGSGQIVEKEYRVEDYNSIHLSLNNARLHIDQAEVPSLIIEAEDNIAKKMSVKIGNSGTVKIGLKDFLRCLRPTQPIDIYASVIDIDKISLSGSGTIDSENGIITDDLEISISGSGEVDLDIDVKNIKTIVSGSANIILRGNAKTHKFSSSGSGELEAYNLLTEETSIGFSGSGSAEVSAIEKLDIDISGSGKVLYKGNPEEITQSVSGSGKIQKTGNSFPANKDNILEALLKKAPELAEYEIDINIKQNTDKHAFGGFGFPGTELGGGLWLATLTDDGWMITHEGNGAIVCQDVEPYGFPASMVKECYDLETNTIIDRTEN